METIEMTASELEIKMRELSNQVRKDTINEIKSLNPFKSETKQNKVVGSDLFKTIAILHKAKSESISVEQAGEMIAEKHTHYGDVATSLKNTTFTAGDALVPVQYSSEIIPQLYNNSAFLGLMPRETMVTKEMKIPKELHYPNVYWGAEIDTTSQATNASFGDVSLSVKGATATIPIPNDKLKEAANTGRDLDTTIINSIIRSIVAAAESNILYGPGNANRPLGIDGKMLVGNKFNSAGTGIANVEADFFKALEMIEGGNITAESPMLVLSSRSKNYLASIQNGLTLPAYPELSEMRFKGIPVGVTNTIPNNTGNGSQSHIWLIDWSKFVLGVFQDMEIFVEENGAYRDSAGVIQSARDNDVTVLRARYKFDFGMFYDKAAAKIEAVSYSL